ncbi:COX1/OXI3 intron 2 protein [Acrasis kona]|uniref:COX1/OXI3 intron 2 protein n=1 Tax=Acrasis kona TaxID=1008807 RepID=A0AAW2Z0F0_9EUKA
MKVKVLLLFALLLVIFMYVSAQAVGEELEVDELELTDFDQELDDDESYTDNYEDANVLFANKEDTADVRVAGAEALSANILSDSSPNKLATDNVAADSTNVSQTAIAALSLSVVASVMAFTVLAGIAIFVCLRRDCLYASLRKRSPTITMKEPMLRFIIDVYSFINMEEEHITDYISYFRQVRQKPPRLKALPNWLPTKINEAGPRITTTDVRNMLDKGRKKRMEEYTRSSVSAKQTGEIKADVYPLGCAYRQNDVKHDSSVIVPLTDKIPLYVLSKEELYDRYKNRYQPRENLYKLKQTTNSRLPNIYSLEERFHEDTYHLDKHFKSESCLEFKMVAGARDSGTFKIPKMSLLNIKSISNYHKLAYRTDFSAGVLDDESALDSNKIMLNAHAATSVKKRKKQKTESKPLNPTSKEAESEKGSNESKFSTNDIKEQLRAQYLKNLELSRQEDEVLDNLMKQLPGLEDAIDQGNAYRIENFVQQEKKRRGSHVERLDGLDDELTVQIHKKKKDLNLETNIK